MKQNDQKRQERDAAQTGARPLPAQPLALLLTALLVFGLLLTGCGGTGAQGDSGTAADPAKASEEPKFEPDDSLITEIYSEEGSYTDEVDNTYTYRYHVPQLAADTEAAKQLNAYMMDTFGAYAGSEMENMDKHASLYYTDISWERSWHGSRLYLKLKADSGDWRVYDVICYDFAAEKAVEPEETIQSMGFTKEEWLSALRKTAIHKFDSTYTDHMPRRTFYDNGGMELKARLLSDEFLNLERPVYVNDQNEISVMIAMPSMAGAAFCYEELPVNMENSGSGDKVLTAEKDSVTAKLQNGTLQIAADGKEYAAEGIFDDYVQMEMSDPGEGDSLYLFLLTAEGRVEFVNLTQGMAYGYCCSGGVLPKITGIQSLEAGTAAGEKGQEHPIMYAISDKGKKKDLTAAVYAAQNAVYSMVTGVAWKTETEHSTDGGSYRDESWVDFSDDHSLRIDTAFAEGAGSIVYQGSYDCLGITEDGLVVTWTVREKGNKKNRHSGVWALQPDFGELAILSKAGTNYFDMPEGEAAGFQETFG